MKVYMANLNVHHVGGVSRFVGPLTDDGLVALACTHASYGTGLA